MARIEISAEDIQRGLPPCCVYCGELTEDRRKFFVEDAGQKKWVPLPHCEDHVIMLHIVHGLFPLGILVLILLGFLLQWIDINVISVMGMIGMFWLFSSSILRGYWFPRAIQDNGILLRNIHRQFCTAVVDRRAEATDGSD
ncbi:MAG: hypothetical protein ACRC8S_12230 [Fimbriiglobus sp.]